MRCLALWVTRFRHSNQSDRKPQRVAIFSNKTCMFGFELTLAAAILNASRWCISAFSCLILASSAFMKLLYAVGCLGGPSVTFKNEFKNESNELGADEADEAGGCSTHHASCAASSPCVGSERRLAPFAAWLRGWTRPEAARP